MMGSAEALRVLSISGILPISRQPVIQSIQVPASTAFGLEAG